MARVAFLAHCLLNQNSKVQGGCKTAAMWDPVIDLLLERGWVIRQMPCPELAFGGVRRLLVGARPGRHAALPRPLPPPREDRRSDDGASRLGR